MEDTREKENTFIGLSSLFNSALLHFSHLVDLRATHGCHAKILLSFSLPT